ncbi:acyl-CoA dehydrogenase family protein [uncultured Sphingomonas sp.]|uniref:acyl-CoA dehydrogenase family protein n=1 Tax=uncultured Sphingomonas sp. TaxID=158754 RepID=UPI00263507EC|nr:acyl-CoA dehydrogenase family protein [uncultured Sphingomonas sp.]
MPNALNLDGIALTREQGRWRRVAEKLAAEVLRPNAPELDRSGAFPEANIAALKASGLLGLLIPKEMGGGGGDVVTAMLVTEALAKGCISTAMIYTMHQSTLPLMCALATEPQVARFLAPIARGELFGAFAMSEPGSGNRIWHMDSHAVADGDDFVIDSFKSFCTSAGHADFYLVPTRGHAEAGAADLSLFWIDADVPGIEPKGEWDGMGLRGNGSRPLHFNKCRVPAGNRFGDATAGFSFMMAYSLPIYLVGLATCYLGLAQEAFDAAVGHVKRRVHSDTGRSLATVETVQRYAAEMKCRIDQARATILRVAQMSDNATVLFDEFNRAGLLDEIIRDNPDDPYFVELAELKILASEMAVQVSHTALQICGGQGYKRGHPVERCYRDARAGSLMGPSDDTLKVIMGNQLLGTPQPWA